MEQFRQIGEVLGSMKALMVLQDNNQINRRQCSLLFDMFNLAFDTLSDAIKHNLKLEEKNMKWKPLEQPLKELCRVFKEAESYVTQCMDSKDWWVKPFYFHNNQDAVEFHLHNLFCHFPIVVETIELAGEISGLDLVDMKKKRLMLSNKYDMTWNDPKLFMWKFGKQYLLTEDIFYRMNNAWKEDQWLLFEMIKEKKMSSLNKREQRLSDLLIKKINEEESFCHSSVLTGAKDYQIRRRLGGGSQYKEMQWLGETFVLRHFYGDTSVLNSEIFQLLALSHPNVVQYICGFHEEEKKEYFLVMELMGKDLSSYIKEVCGSKRQVPFAFVAAVDIMLQIARGMEYLHSKKIYHGELNPSNVFIRARNSSSEGYLRAKISGFGLKGVKTTTSRGSSPNQNEILPFIWQAPEVLTEQERPGNSGKYKYSEKADVYSFGMLCFELLTGKVPFEDLHLQGDKMSRNIQAGERPLFPFSLPKYLTNLTKKCWQTDPTQRPCFSSICRILRYVKRLIVMSPHLAQPEISSTIQVDFCDLETSFMKKFPVEASAASTPVYQIPFQLFTYRLAEKEKLSWAHSDKNWETHSEVLFPSHDTDEMVDTLEGSFSLATDSKSMCLEIPERRLSPLRRVSSITTDQLQVHDMSVSAEIPEEKVPVLRKSISATGHSSHARLVCMENLKKAPNLKKCNTIHISKNLDETRPPCTEIPAKKVQEKRDPVTRKSSSMRMTEDSVGTDVRNKRSLGTTTLFCKGKANGKTKGPSNLISRGHSPVLAAEKLQQPLSKSHKAWRSKHKQSGHSSDNST